MTDVPNQRPASTRWRVLFTAVLRESRASRGRMFFFTLCLALGVAAVVGVSSLTATMRDGMSSDSRALMAGDLRVEARRVLPDLVDEYFAAIPHRRTDLVEMSAMAFSPNARETTATSRLVELKVVTDTYPLYGQLELNPSSRSTADLGSNRVFIGEDLAVDLELQVGEALRIGGAEFEVAALIENEPDRIDFSLTLGPRVLMGAAGLERTQLFGEKSRVRYISLFAFEDFAPNELKSIERELDRALEGAPYVRVRVHSEPQSSVRRWIGRVEEFLGLDALLSLLLGGIGVSQIVRAWLAGRTQSVAVMRCLGFRAREIAALYLGHVALLALIGCLIGGLLGAGLPFIVRIFAPALFHGTEISLWQPGALMRGVGLGLFVAALFSVPPLTAVWRVSPATVLRSEAAPLAAPKLVRYGAALSLLLCVLISARVQAGEWIPALAFSGGLIALTGLLYGGARLTSFLASRLPRGRLGPYLENGFAALSRPGSGTTVAIVALGLGVLVVVSMWLIESQLGRALRTGLPADAPSVFLVDVQPDQWDGVHDVMLECSGESIDMVPVVMARMRSIDGRDVHAIAEERSREGRATWVYTREQRLTWLAKLASSNELIEGEWWSDPDRAEVSLEQGFADDLGVGLGAVLTMDVHGIPFEFTVTSIRKVDWLSFGINFFLVVEPGVLEAAPHFRLATARFENADEEIALQNRLADAYPNVTTLRLRPRLEQLAEVFERLAFGIRTLGSFTILTGLVILAGAVATTATRRAREAALLKTLGVTRGGVALLFACEYALIGLVAGSLGAVGALALAWGFLGRAELDFDLPALTLPVAALATSVLAMLSGLVASSRALTTRPIATLRG